MRRAVGAGGEGSCWPEIAALAEQSEDEVRRALTRLEKCGLWWREPGAPARHFLAVEGSQ